MTFLRVVFLTLSQNYRTRRRPPLAKTRPWAGSRLGSGRGPGTSSGVRRRVRPRPAEVRHQGLADQQHQPGVRHGPAGVRPPSGRIRRGLGTRVLLTCLGPADPPYRGGSSNPPSKLDPYEPLKPSPCPSNPSWESRSRSGPGKVTHLQKPVLLSGQGACSRVLQAFQAPCGSTDCICSETG